MSNIDPNKLSALHDYLVAGGSAEQEDIAAQLGIAADDEATVDAYVEALKAAHPTIYGEPAAAPEAPAPRPAAKKAATKQAKPTPAPSKDAADALEGLKYFFRTEAGLIEPLQLVTHSKGNVVLCKPVKKDLVTLTVRGKSITVDLVELAKYPTDSPHGVPNSKLIELAELARG